MSPRQGLDPLHDAVGARLEAMASEDVVGRIWRRDHTVWKPEPTEITNRLGWLTVMQAMREKLAELEAFATRAAADGYSRAVLLGMGGSSLAAEVLRASLGIAQGSLDLTVLDTTHPATVERLTESVDPNRTLFVAASKSGTTVETLAHLAHFWDKIGRGDQFVAITDPGTPLEAMAHENQFRSVFLNPEDIGGRYSALSNFGLVPAALIGTDLTRLLDAAEEMAAACLAGPADNPGARLGAVMAEAALAGRDKLTLAPLPVITTFGNWVEQLIAESTGKEGRGILPVIGEDPGPPGVYGEDRLFVTTGEDPRLGPLEAAGHPVVRLADGDPIRIGAEFFRWEFATAVAGHVLGINPFDQPNVAEAKAATDEILQSGEAEDPGLDDLAGLLGHVKAGDYVAIHAYLDPAPRTVSQLHRIRLAIRDRFKVATTVGFGPRLVHSTGQFHKGGPNNGVFVQVVDEGRRTDAPIPGVRYSFGNLIDAQALGDLRSLRKRGRRVGRVTLERLLEVM
ncbi:MAG: glucose-6-phosphate isomerase [Actinomycetota bacterium]